MSTAGCKLGLHCGTRAPDHPRRNNIAERAQYTGVQAVKHHACTRPHASARNKGLTQYDKAARQRTLLHPSVWMGWPLGNHPPAIALPGHAPFDGVGQALAAAHERTDVQRLVLLQVRLKLCQLHVPAAAAPTHPISCAALASASSDQWQNPTVLCPRKGAPRHKLIGAGLLPLIWAR